MYSKICLKHQPRQPLKIHHQPWMRLIYLLMLMAFLSSMAGCLIGVKTRIVTASIAKYPEEANGSIIIQTNKPILVKIQGSEYIGKLDLGGRIVIMPNDLKLLIEALKENQELKKMNGELKRQLQNN